ncbi:MAG: catalase [Eubacteriales bacterium]|nr:catalase [Eubacteriales bacterium]
MLTIELIETIARLNRMRIPEPMTHAKGAGAHGVFIPYMSMKEYTKACFLQDSNIETPIFVRFSRMMGRAGSADTIRDVRGFFVKFHTREGDYDLIGSHIPIFYIRDPQKYPNLISALSPCPQTNIRDPERLWRFVAENPESMHMITWLYSDLGTIKSYRTMEGHSVHTYVWQNVKKECFWVRYHWKPLLGTKEISRQEAEFLAGFDPDVASRDLSDSLREGKKIYYELCVQIIPTIQETENELSILDPVCIWPESLVPLVRVGKMIIFRGVNNYHEEVEKAAFSPGNLIPGIALSPEPLLLATVFACMDGQRYRLGVDGSNVNIESSIDGIRILDAVREKGEVNNNQLALRLQSMSSQEKKCLIDNMVEDMLFIDEGIQKTIVGYLKDVDLEVGASLEKWLSL